MKRKLKDVIEYFVNNADIDLTKTSLSPQKTPIGIVKKYLERNTRGIGDKTENPPNLLPLSFREWIIELAASKLMDVVQVESIDRKGYLRIKIDLTTPKNIILLLINKLLSNNKSVQEWRQNNKPKTRFRKEQRDALRVWEERRLRKPFKRIARELNVKEPACKKMFYKAYELLFGKKYNPADFEKPEIKKEYLKKECGTCKERPTCKDLCPDAMAYAEQDNKSYQREITFSALSKK